MGFLDRLLHRTSTATEAAASTTCPHTALLPRWDNLADLGQLERVTGYHCDSCGKDFTPAEFQTLRATEAERVRGIEGPPAAD